MDLLPKEKYKRIPLIIFYIIIGIISFYIILKYALTLVLPFVISYIISLCISPLIKIINKKTKIPVKLLSIIFVITVLTVICFSAFLLFEKTLNEIKEIIDYLSYNFDETIQSIVKFLENKIGDNTFLKQYIEKEYIIMLIEKMGTSFFENVSKSIPEIITKAITALPNIIFVTIVTITASYYFCVDSTEIIKDIKKPLPRKIKKEYIKLRAKTTKILINFTKGYIVTFIITFTQLFIGFKILEIEYAFTVALIISLLDILPVIGIGTIMIPWGLIQIILGNVYLGSGILIVFGVASIIRQVTEPKILGKSIGLHPVITLFSMYIGLKLFGITGIITCPVIAILIKNTIEIEEK